MNGANLFQRYHDLQRYVGWSEEDALRIQLSAPLLQPHLQPLVEDFYDEIKKHPNTLKVITGGEEQIQRLKQTLHGWLTQLLAGPYDAEYVARRWRVGWKHVEIGLDQVYTNVAMSRLRNGLIRLLIENWTGEARELQATLVSLHKLIDLDLAIIEDAYQTEYMARLRGAERLATIGQVAGGVAHELRNPLNVVKTSVYYLLNARRCTPEKKQEHLQRIEKQVSAADGVITALTSFARLPLPDLQPFSVSACLRTVLELNPLPESIQLVQNIPDDLPPALADEKQIHIVLGNLIRNAREAMPQEGQLTLSATAQDGYISLDICDSGVGIPPEQLSRIMEPLFSTKARGLGLGLAISRAVLEKNQGSLHVQSTPGQGSTFTVRLPAAQPEQREEGLHERMKDEG